MQHGMNDDLFDLPEHQLDPGELEDGEAGEDEQAQDQEVDLEPEVEPRPPQVQPQPPRELWRNEVGKNDVPTESVMEHLLSGIVTGVAGKTRIAFVSGFTGVFAGLKQLAGETYDEVTKLGKVKPTLGQSLSRIHNRNYGKFQGYLTRKHLEGQERRGHQRQEVDLGLREETHERRGVDPLTVLGSLFWGDLRRQRKLKARIRQGRASEGDKMPGLDPGEAGLRRYAAKLDQKLHTVVWPLVHAIQQLHYQNGVPYDMAFANRLVLAFRGHVATAKMQGQLVSGD
jgi:hypothetical protein